MTTLRGALVILLLMLGACEQHRGYLQEECNPDGTCNAPGLFCGQTIGGGYRCFPREAK